MANGFTDFDEKIIAVLLKKPANAADVIAHCGEIRTIFDEYARAMEERIAVATQGLELLDPVCRCNMKGPAQEFGHITGCLAMTALKILKNGPAGKTAERCTNLVSKVSQCPLNAGHDGGHI
jgi:hypothetical protein